MDEGWATTFEYLIGTADLGQARADEFFRQFRVNGWAEDPSPLEDLPIITPGDMLRGAGLGNNEYGKPALGYLAAKELLGDALFKKSLQAFIERWHGKHPIPWDFFNTMNDASGRDLNWFWSNWFFSHGYIDLAVAAPVKNATGYSVAVRNIGGMAAPFDVVVQYQDNTTSRTHYTPAVWEANQAETRVTVASAKPIVSIVLEGGIWVDADPSNNRWVRR
jgi:aminopeptidase N